MRGRLDLDLNLPAQSERVSRVLPCCVLAMPASLVVRSVGCRCASVRLDVALLVPPGRVTTAGLAHACWWAGPLSSRWELARLSCAPLAMSDWRLKSPLHWSSGRWEHQEPDRTWPAKTVPAGEPGGKPASVSVRLNAPLALSVGSSFALAVGQLATGLPPCMLACGRLWLSISPVCLTPIYRGGRVLNVVRPQRVVFPGMTRLQGSRATATACASRWCISASLGLVSSIYVFAVPWFSCCRCGSNGSS